MTAPAAVELGAAAKFIRGITFKPEDVVPIGTPGAAACMRTKNVQTELNLSDVWGIPESLVRRDDQYLIPGDILISSANSWNLVGKCCWVPNLPWRSTFGGFISVLRANPTMVDPRYLFRWFASDRTQVTVRSFGQQTTNISNLNVDRCSKLKLRLPPLPEQRRIAEILDKADALRSKRRAALAQLDTLTQSIFLDMFGDPATNPKGTPTARLGDLCTRITDGTHQPPVWSEAGHPFLFVSNIISGEIDFDTDKFISDSTHAELTRRCPIEIGDVLYSTVGSYGVPAVVRNPRKFAFQRHIAHLKPNRELLDPEFLRVMLGSQPLKQQADRFARGVAQKTINLSDIREYVVFQPHMDKQRQLTQRVMTVENMKVVLRTALADLDALFASLQHRAFRGEL
jgi:type I restriction enzyme S subunit